MRGVALGLPSERQEGKTEAADVTQPQLLLKFARCRTKVKSFPPMHLPSEPPTPRVREMSRHPIRNQGVGGSNPPSPAIIFSHLQKKNGATGGPSGFDPGALVPIGASLLVICDLLDANAATFLSTLPSWPSWILVYQSVRKVCSDGRPYGFAPGDLLEQVPNHRR
jgi:hypothetical protein